MSKVRLLCLSLVVLLLFPAYEVGASTLDDLQNDNLHILIVYAGEENNYHPRLQELQLIFHHFTKEVTIKHIHALERDDFEDMTHLVYVELTDQTISREKIDILNQVNKPFIYIGENVDLFPSFRMQLTDEDISFSEITKDVNEEALSTRYVQEGKQWHLGDNQEALVFGKNHESTYPLLVKLNDKRYAVQVNRDDQEMSRVLRNFFIDVLHNILPNDHVNKQYAMLRLADIDPNSDPEQLLEIGEFLNEQKIPYHLIVTPVTYDPANNQYHYLSEQDELVEVLRTLSDSYGRIIAHGYQHTYYEEDIYFGAEFWDSKHNQMINNMHAEDAEAHLQKESFHDDEEFATYVKSLQEEEEIYIRKRLESGVYELVYADLYPLAFEIPNYNISLNGYRILSHYFEGLVGRVQTADDGDRITNAPVITTGSFLYDMAYYPETIGYYDVNDPSTLGDMKEKVREINVIRDGVYSGFFHPYLGLDAFKRFYSVFEEMESIEWIDLGKEDLQVTTAYASWDGNPLDGSYKKIDEKTIQLLIRDQPRDMTEWILWMVTFIVIAFILLFLGIAFYLRMNIRKKLFDERKQ